MHQRRIFLCLLLVTSAYGTSCAEPTALGDVLVAEARFRDLTTVGFAVIGGGSAGSAVLEIDTVDGENLIFDLSVTGGIVGGMMDMGVSRLNGEAEFDLSFVEEPTGTDLLGGYDGFVASGAMLLGGAYHGLENEAHISLDLGGFMTTLGMSMIVGHEWLHLDVDTDDGGLDDEPAEVAEELPGETP